MRQALFHALQFCALLTLAPLACAGSGAVDTPRLLNVDHEPGSWLTTGRTYAEQRYSPLKQINDKNVDQL